VADDDNDNDDRGMEGEMVMVDDDDVMSNNESDGDEVRAIQLKALVIIMAQSTRHSRPPARHHRARKTALSNFLARTAVCRHDSANGEKWGHCTEEDRAKNNLVGGVGCRGAIVSSYTSR
jgi:hypothetical protein